ncbi:MAG: protease [Pseudomonadales bacterium]|nr:protease [Pseudomonadales bacterium]HAG96095.1 protease [Gammaproteobacteria bacterium]HAU13995.1 protease [Gammaproteobacteria bacterium]|tara:strand:- start:7231 stop:9138 length:1908 start_codon:yes stop_codon:yes gene_type:complete
MSFYQNQDNARRKTGLLLFYFISAILLIIAAVNLSLYLVLILASEMNMPFWQWLQHPFCWGIAGATLAAIAVGSLMRLAQLSKGGVSVALMAGGTPLDSATKDPRERMLINVVEEMSIASGTSVPRLFIMRDEPGINAFVAGTDTSNTVLAVTQGSLEKLTRDELQGVIGHEFSHILNGDMKLNVRLIGILAGILFIGQIGEFLLRGQSHRHYYGRRSGKDGNQLIPLGLALMLIGYVGLFFGRLIKAAISRQREFLADASSVQFTRNPDGIASALYAIQHYSGNSLLMGAHAEDMNHMCFGETVKMQLSSMLATHPPIEDRIRAIDRGLLPRLKARFRKREELPHTAVDATAATGTPATAQAAAQNFAGNPTLHATPKAVKESIGAPSPEHYDYAQQLHQQIPHAINELAHSLDSADAVLYALLLLESPTLTSLPVALPQAALALREQLQQAGPQIRLPLLDICLATLKQAEPAQRNHIIKHAIDLIKLDRKVTLSEFVYCFLVQQNLSEIRRPARTIKRYQPLEPALATLFSALVQVSGDGKDRQRENFSNIMQYYSTTDYSSALGQPPSPKGLNQALQQLKRLAPLLKQPVVDACVDCILHDNKATLKEMELLRAICEALECPLPPILVHTG